MGACEMPAECNGKVLFDETEETGMNYYVQLIRY